MAFYLTLGVPLLYGLNLWLIGLGGSLNLNYGIRIVGLVACFVGILLWILSYFGLGRSFGVLPKKQKRIRRGIYGFLRHPMYVGIMLCFVGLSVANGSESGLSFSLFVMMPLLWWRAGFEEGRLMND